MRAWRLIATGTIVLAAASCSTTAGAAGTTASPAPKPPATIPADPAAAIVAAKAQLGTESARFGVDGGRSLISFSGTVNAKTKNWEITGKDFVVRRVGMDIYVKASGTTLKHLFISPAAESHLTAGGWVHTQMPPRRNDVELVYNDAFPWNLANLATNATGMARTGNRAFSGTLTAKDTRPVSTPRPDAHMRVDVDLDQQGRFSKITVDSKDDAATAFTFSDYGVPAEIAAPPPADVVEEDEFEFLDDLGLL